MLRRPGPWVPAGVRALLAASRPVHPDTATALAQRWDELPPAVKSPSQLLGRRTAGCEGTHGVFPRCDLACTPCYHAAEAQRVRTDARHTVAEVDRQMAYLRTVRGTGQHAQLIGGEVTLLGPAAHAATLEVMQAHGRKPMSMSHGDFDDDYLRTLALKPDGTRRFRALSFAGHFDSLMLGRRGLPRPRSESELDEPRRRFVAMFQRLHAEHGVRFDLAHTMTVTPRNLGEVAGVVRSCARLHFGMLSFQPAARVGNPRRWKEDYAAVTIDAVWAELERGIGTRLPWAHLQMGDARCNRSAYGVLAAGRWTPLLDDRDPRDLRARDRFLDTFGGMDFQRAPLPLALALLRVIARRPSLGRDAACWALRFARRAGTRRLITGRPRSLTFVVHAFMDARVVGPAWEATRRGVTSADPEVRAAQERLAACSYAMAHPQDGRLVPACVQHAVLDPAENRGPRGAVADAHVSDRYDLVVLGGGTAGLVSSMIAAGLGARVALIERDRTGGDCLWTGCVPSKSLIAAARLAHQMRHADRVGLTPVVPELDFGRVMDRVHAAIAELEPHDAPARLRAAGVEVIQGHGRFVDGSRISVAHRSLRFSAAIVATGSTPVVAAIDGLGEDAVLTSDTVWALRELPPRLVVLGGGPIGCELGQAFARLGARVTLIEEAERLLGREEPPASRLIAEHLRADGVDVRVRTRAVAVQRGADTELVLDTEGRRSAVGFDRLLMAAGRRPRTDALGLDAAGVATDHSGAVIVDDRLRTTATRIFAAGDITGGLRFTHVAAHHARIATVNALLGMRRKVDQTIPSVTFTDPELARVGLTEAEARARWGGRAIVARSEYAALDRAVTDGVPWGFALLVADPRGRLVGATVAATAGGETIAELTVRVRERAPIDTVSTTVHAYPTFAEGASRAADDHLRTRYAARRYRALTRPLLLARRLTSPW